MGHLKQTLYRQYDFVNVMKFQGYYYKYCLPIYLAFLSVDHYFGKLNDAMEYQNDMKNIQNIPSLCTNIKLFFMFKLELGNFLILIETTF